MLAANCSKLRSLSYLRLRSITLAFALFSKTCSLRRNLKSAGRKAVGVQVPLRAPKINRYRALFSLVFREALRNGKFFLSSHSLQLGHAETNSSNSFSTVSRVRYWVDQDVLPLRSRELFSTRMTASDLCPRSPVDGDVIILSSF